MAHHIAELLRDSQSARSPAERRRASKAASIAILELWKERQALPGNAYPLQRYMELYKVLDALSPSVEPWRVHDGTPEQKLAISLFDVSRRIASRLLAMGVKPTKVPPGVRRLLSEPERVLLDATIKWGEGVNKRPRLTLTVDGETTKLMFPASLEEDLERAIESLQDLRRRLRPESPPKRASSSKSGKRKHSGSRSRN